LAARRSVKVHSLDFRKKFSNFVQKAPPRLFNISDRAREYDLKRIFKKILEDTNWRLMIDGVNYRLGVFERETKRLWEWGGSAGAH